MALEIEKSLIREISYLVCGKTYFRLFSNSCQVLSRNNYVHGGDFLIYSQIQSLCKTHNTSIARLEKEIGLGNGTIGRWKKSSPTTKSLKLVADFFGVGLDELLSVSEHSEERVCDK